MSIKKCLNCGNELKLERGEIIKCENCLFYNMITTEKTFNDHLKKRDEGDLKDKRLDPILSEKKKIESDTDKQLCHFVWPSITLSEFQRFKEESPKRAESLYKFLTNNDDFSDEDDTRLRIFMSEVSRSDLSQKINYIKIKQKATQLLKKNK